MDGHIDVVRDRPFAHFEHLGSPRQVTTFAHPGKFSYEVCRFSCVESIVAFQVRTRGRAAVGSPGLCEAISRYHGNRDGLRRAGRVALETPRVHRWMNGLLEAGIDGLGVGGQYP